MKEKIGQIFKSSYCFEWYYIIVILGYVATLFGKAVRPGVVASIWMIFIFVELLIKNKMNIRNTMDVLIVVYFFYRTLSVIWIIRQGLPVSVFLKESAASLIPMIFYFAGKVETKFSFYKKYLYAMVLLGVVGLLFYAIAPQFYCDYLFDWSYISKADVATMRVRMHSVVGSTLLGALMVIGMASAACYFHSDNEKEARKNRIVGVCFILFTMFFAIMSNQRSSMVCGFLLLLYTVICVFFVFKTAPKKNLFLGIGVAVLFVILLCLVRFDFILKIWWRIESIPSAVSERNGQWIDAINHMNSILFGNGLGANGHKALGILGTHVITDGGLAKIYTEEGILGSGLFFAIILLSFIKGIKNFEQSFFDLGILFVIILTAIGANVLSFQLVTPIFWFAIGHIVKEVKKDEMVIV